MCRYTFVYPFHKSIPRVRIRRIIHTHTQKKKKLFVCFCCFFIPRPFLFLFLWWCTMYTPTRLLSVCRNFEEGERVWEREPPPPPPFAHRLFRPGAASIMPYIQYYPPPPPPWKILRTPLVSTLILKYYFQCILPVNITGMQHAKGRQRPPFASYHKAWILTHHRWYPCRSPSLILSQQWLPWQHERLTPIYMMGKREIHRN